VATTRNKKTPPNAGVTGENELALSKK